MLCGNLGLLFFSLLVDYTSSLVSFALPCHVLELLTYNMVKTLSKQTFFRKIHISSSLDKWFLRYKEILEPETDGAIYTQITNFGYFLK